MELELREIVFFTPQFKIEGQIKVPASGYRGRLSDFLNQGQQNFIPVLNPTISFLQGEIVASFPETVLLSKSTIIIAFEQEKAQGA